MSNNLKKITATAAATGALTLGILHAAAGSANAASISHSTSTGSLEATDWEKTLGVSKFDSSLGTLDRVILELRGDITGSIKYENESQSAAAITAELTSGIGVQTELELFPGFSVDLTLIESNPLYSDTQNVAAFDDQRDFEGDSGNTLLGLSATETITQTLTESLYLDLFTGTGDITLDVFATGQSSVSGSGNITVNFTNNAYADLKVTYEYTENTPAAGVPEPTTVGGFLLALGALGARLRNRVAFSRTS